MAHQKPVEPWPVWGRALFWVVVAVVLVAAAVAAFSGDGGGAASAARVVTSVAIAGLLLGGVNLLMSRLAGRSVRRLDESLRRLEEVVDDPRILAAARRGRSQLAAGDVEAARATVEEMAAGPASGPAAAAVAESRRAARGAARLKRRQQRAAR